MSPEVKRHVFEPFFTTKPMGRGTGLGLATIFGVVKQAGGVIDFDSEVGRGTTFRIHLPRIAGSAAKLAGSTVESPPPTGDETVLFVEDEDSVRDLVSRALQRLSYEVLSAPNGGEAFLIAERREGRIEPMPGHERAVDPRGIRRQGLQDGAKGLRPAGRGTDGHGLVGRDAQRRPSGERPRARGPVPGPDPGVWR
jgi:hypothetical protein